MNRLALGCAALIILGACGDDSDGSGTSSGSSGAASSTTDPSTSGGSSTSGGTTTTASSTSAGESSSGGGDTSSSGGSESSTGTQNMCDTVVSGEWNACFDENGNPSPVLCNWMGTGKSVGSAGCLSGPTEGSNVCMIRGCEDVCDCFAAPQTGDAPVECREVLEGGGMACILNCADGQTCPDGMTCDGGLCFHFPA